MARNRRRLDTLEDEALDFNDEEQDECVFAATAGMRRYARACCDSQVPQKAEDRCRAANVSPPRLERWRRNRRFEPWLHGEIRRLMSLQTTEIWAVVMRQAREGNLHAAKLYLERFDRTALAARMVPDTFRALAELASRFAPTQPAHGDASQADPLPRSAEQKSQPASGPDDAPNRHLATTPQNDEEVRSNG